MTKAKPLVVIIEDDPASAEALTLTLRDWGAEVVHGISHDTLERDIGARGRDVGWIITDFDLGAGRTGVSLVQELAAIAPQARVLVVSGSASGRARMAAAQAGYDIMRKPLPAKDLLAWLERG
jgi:DNA-binding NtrC family response regulator